MLLAESDWESVLWRAGIILAAWIGLWLLRRLLVIRLPAVLARWVAVELDERDTRVLAWAAEIILLIIGLMVTLLILNLAPWALIQGIGSRLIALIVVWLLVWLLVRYFSFWIGALNQHIRGIDLDQRDITTLDRLLDFAFILVGIIISFAILGLTPLLYSALTAAGVVGIIVGFAVKDIAANLISGLFILIDRPFVIGDAIKVKDMSGTVSKISLRSTQIVTFDGPVVTIPNSMLATEPTTNYSVNQFRRILFVVSVLSTVDLHRAIQVIREVLDAEPRLLADRPPTIYVDRIRDYAIDLQITAFTAAADLFDTQSDLKQAVTIAFASHGIELAVPVQVSYVAEASPGAPFTGLSPRPNTADHERPLRHD